MAYELKSQTSRQSATKRLLRLALPTFGQLIAEPAFILIDTAIIGHVSVAALAGLSLGSTVVLTAVGLCIFLAYATTSHIAQLFGAHKLREGLQAGIDSLWLSLVIGIVLAFVLFICAEPLCSLLGGTGDDLIQAVTYTRLVILGVPGMLLVYAANGIFRGLQKITITLVAAISGAILNTILDIVFVIICGWGIAGSGIATMIAQWFMGVFLVAPALRWALQNGLSLRPHREGIVAVGGNGFPLFLRTLALRMALVATVMAAATLGTSVLAGYQVVNATWNVAVNVLDSVAIAGQTLVGARLGAHQYDEARMLTRATARAGLATGIVVGVLFIIAGLFAAPAFSPNPEVQLVTSTGMIITGATLPLQGWMWALDGILIGAGDFRYLALTLAAAATVYCALLVVSVMIVFPSLPGIIEKTALLWLEFDLILMGVRALANGLRARKDIWMRK